MSTNINITVGGDGLLERAAQLQTANRQAKLESDADKKLSAQAAAEREAALAAQGKDANGNPLSGTTSPLYGNRFQQPDIDRRPAANRTPVDGFVHAWLLGDTYEPPGAPGVIETNAPGTDPGQFNYELWKGSRTGNYSPTSTKNNVLIGSGKGNSWITFTGKGNEDLPELPADIWNPVAFPDVSFYGPSEVDFFLPHDGERYSMHPITSNRVNITFALPCGNKSFILVYGFTGVWHMVKTLARYTVRGWYSPSKEFLGYEQRDPVTGELIPGYSPTPPDWVRGDSAFGDTMPFPPETALQPNGAPLYNNGLWNYEGFRGKARKVKAYVCSNTSVREISIPATLQQIIDIAYPDAIEGTTALQYRQNFLPYASYTIPSSPGIYGDAGLKAANNRGSVFTPEVFESLNNVIPFVPSSSIKQFPANLSWGMYDTSEGAYASYQDTTPGIFETPTFWSQLYREGLPFYHAYWIQKNQEPNYQIYDPDYAADWEGVSRPRRIPKATLNLSPDRTPREGAEDRGTTVGSYWEEDFLTVWDWNDPGYCRSMCLSLGFTAADLTP